MKQLLLIFLAFGALFLTGCAVFEEDAVPVATVEQTAAVFDEVISRDKWDIVMCHLVKTEHATCKTLRSNVIVRYDWYDVLYSVKNFLMTGDKFVIVQHIDSPLREYTPDYRTYNNSEIVYFDIDRECDSVLGPVIAPLGSSYYIWFTEGPTGDLLNPARIGQKYDYLPNAKEAFFRVKKSYWQKRDPNVNIHWHQGPRQTPVKSGKMEKEKLSPRILSQ